MENVETAVSLLSALFDEQDLVLFRPIETWTDAGRKCSRVDYRNTCYTVAQPQLLQDTVLQLLRLAARERLNLFFGVCPRLGDRGRCDLAWQIRTVRALWSDIDHVTVEAARERLAKTKLPPPSIIVNSGNGVHLYWLLDQPYQIDDVGDPPKVEAEWVDTAGGRNKPRKYIEEDGERVYLDQRRHVSRLSTKAHHLQNVLAVVAQACGGDHTTDLSRLLRLPGTLNRKDQRNDREPTPTALVTCDPTIRYPISVFESLATPARETERANKIAVMPLPRTRKASISKADRLAELIAASAIARPGRRSEVDFAACCYAVRNGIDKEEVWKQVEPIGKFAEQGRRYFDITWENAEYETRSELFARLEKRAAPGRIPPHQPENVSPDAANGRPGQPPNQSCGLDCEEPEGPGQPTILIDPTTTPVSETMRRITDRLLEVGGCYRRVEQLVVVRDGRITSILSTAELAGLLNHHVEFYFVDAEGGEFKPLPASYGNIWLHHPGERPRLPAIRLFTRNPVFSDDWRLVAPGYDQASGIYYAGPEVAPREGTIRLDALLRDFCFKSRADRTNYLGVLLTTLLIPRFVGCKPAVLFNGNQPELGKTILAQIIAVLRDGRPVATASYNPNDEEFEKRLGSIVRRGATTIIIDNAKGRARNPRIESACLERSITDPILSFRLLGSSQDIQAENSHIFCLTANSPDVSRDLVTRSVVVNLHHEGNPGRRTFSITDPESYAQEHRHELLGELIGMVQRWKALGMPQANVLTRFNKRGWGPLIGGILDACGQPDFLANAEEAATQLDDTRRDFTDLVATLADHPQGIWTAAELVEHCGKHGLLQGELGNGSARSKATRLGVIAGRYVAERFGLPDGRAMTFLRSQDRRGKIYRVGITDEVPNV
jgi:hypothetical protein